VFAAPLAAKSPLKSEGFCEVLGSGTRLLLASGPLNSEGVCAVLQSRLPLVFVKRDGVDGVAGCAAADAYVEPKPPNKLPLAKGDVLPFTPLVGT
jgi:hypothetical protein